MGDLAYSMITEQLKGLLSQLNSATAGPQSVVSSCWLTVSSQSLCSSNSAVPERTIGAGSD